MSIFTKKPWYFMIDYYVDGKRKREYAGRTKKDAEYLLSKRKTQIYEGKLDLQALHGKMLFRDFAENYLRKSKAYKRSYRRETFIIRYLVDFLGSKPLGKITASDIESYRENRLMSVTKSSVNRETIVLRHMLNTAIRLGKIIRNPMRDTKQYKIQEQNIRVLSKDEEIKLLEASCRHLKPIIITALNTGMRLGELLNLRWDNVDMDREVITVTETKSNRIRHIPIYNDLKETLKCVKLANERVFCDNNGRPMESIKTAFKNAVRRSGIRHFRFHDLRHTFVAHHLKHGVSLVLISKVLGHKRISTTERYLEYIKDRAKENNVLNEL